MGGQKEPEQDQPEQRAAERDDYLMRLKRAVADYQNLQKRIEKFRDVTRNGDLKSLSKAILPVADSLALAQEAAEQTEGADNIVEGLKLVVKEFYGALEKLDIRPVPGVGHKFDPHYHEAVMQQPAEDVEPNTVLRELKRGFTLGDIVIRPSKVIVAGPIPAWPDEGAQS